MRTIVASFLLGHWAPLDVSNLYTTVVDGMKSTLNGFSKCNYVKTDRFSLHSLTSLFRTDEYTRETLSARAI